MSKLVAERVRDSIYSRTSKFWRLLLRRFGVFNLAFHNNAFGPDQIVQLRNVKFLQQTKAKLFGRIIHRKILLDQLPQRRASSVGGDRPHCLWM